MKKVFIIQLIKYLYNLPFSSIFLNKFKEGNIAASTGAEIQKCTKKHSQS